jgi:tetratricopeptide (TPR) repeat protein
MSKSDVLTRKDMKEPDKFQQAATQAASWMAARRKHVVAAGAAAVALVLLLAILSAVQSRRTARAGAAAADLLAIVNADVSAVPLPGVPGPSFQTDEAKQRAIVAGAEKVLAEHGGTPAGALAALAAGDAHLRLREWDAAKAAYERFLSDAGKDDSLRFGALEGVGLAEEGKGNLDAAAQAYERFGREAPAFADRADLDRARVLVAAGKTAEAKDLLARFSEAHKDSQLTAEAAERVARLGGAK